MLNIGIPLHFKLVKCQIDELRHRKHCSSFCTIRDLDISVHAMTQTGFHMLKRGQPQLPRHSDSWKGEEAYAAESNVYVPTAESMERTRDAVVYWASVGEVNSSNCVR